MKYCLIETAIGTFGLGWTEQGVARAALPDNRAGSVGQWMARFGTQSTVPAGEIAELVADIQAYARGEQVQFDEVELDLEGQPEFHRRVYDDILRLGWGETTTYGDIARRLGDVALSRAVGQALGANPIPLIIPCHRVLASNGRAGGFSAPGGVSSKMKMLSLERAASPEGQFSFGF
ncbi:MAG TPA: methylated-DNA--[protein]-cysteine S-methyltransferase [Devosia sp.]